MEENTTSVNNEQVAEVQTTEAVTSENNEQVAEVQTTEAVTSENNVEVARPQTAEENAHFAEMRRKQELDETRAELNRLKEQNKANEMLLNAVKSYGYEGSAEDIALNLEAQAKGVEVEELKREKENNSVIAENEELKRQLTDIKMQQKLDEDMTAISKLFKNATLDDEEKDKFIKFRAMGLSEIDAYSAIDVTRQKTKVNPPEVVGEVKATATESDVFTNQQLDKLTKEQLIKDPNLLSKALRSLNKLK